MKLQDNRINMRVYNMAFSKDKKVKTTYFYTQNIFLRALLQPGHTLIDDLLTLVPTCGGGGLSRPKHGLTVPLLDQGTQSLFRSII